MSKRKFIPVIILAVTASIALTGCVKIIFEEPDKTPDALMTPVITAPRLPENSEQLPSPVRNTAVEELYPLVEYSFDPDEDGETETRLVITDEVQTGSIRVNMIHNGYEANVPEDGYFVSAYYWVFPNGKSCVSVSLSGESDSWRTVFYSPKAEGFEKTCEMSGYIGHVDQTDITVRDYIDALGTYEAHRDYTLNEDIAPLPSGDGLWHIAENDVKYITNVKELPVEMMKNGTYTAAALAPGTSIMITATDCETFALFELPNKSGGRLFFTRADYELLIDGTDEWEWFETLPYSG